MEIRSPELFRPQWNIEADSPSGGGAGYCRENIEDKGIRTDRGVHERQRRATIEMRVSRDAKSESTYTAVDAFEFASRIHYANCIFRPAPWALVFVSKGGDRGKMDHLEQTLC